MSLDDFVNDLLSQKAAEKSLSSPAPNAVTLETRSSASDSVQESFDELIKAAGAANAVPQTASPPSDAAPASDVTSDEVSYMRNELVRLMKDLNASRKEVQLLKANEGATKAADAEAVAAQSAGGQALLNVQFPWKKHISAVEDAVRKKNTPLAECALNVLVDVSEVVVIDPPARARLLTQLGTIRIDKSQIPEAEETLLKAMALLEATDSQKTLAGAACLDALAQCHQVREQLEDAEKLRRQAVVIAEDALGAEHPDVGFFRERLELLRQERAIAMIGNDEGSKTILDKLSEAYNAAVASGADPAPPPEAPVDSYSGFMFEKFIANARNALTQKNIREAENALRSAMEKSAGVPNSDPKKCEGVRLLAQVLEQQGKDMEAKQQYEEAATLAFKHIGWNDIQLAHCLRSLALLHARLEDFGTGKNYYKQAIAAFTTISGKEDPVTVELEEGYKSFIERLKQERQWKGWAT